MRFHGSMDAQEWALGPTARRSGYLVAGGVCVRACVCMCACACACVRACVRVFALCRQGAECAFMERDAAAGKWRDAQDACEFFLICYNSKSLLQQAVRYD